ncbi:unnamed protein product, partial [Prorocentrum cordatum]
PLTAYKHCPRGETSPADLLPAWRAPPAKPRRPPDHETLPPVAEGPPRGGRPRGRGAAPPRGTLGGLRARGHGRTIGGCARRARVPTSARGPGEEEGGGRKDAQGVFLRQGALLLGGGAVRAGAARTPGRAARQAGPGPRKPRRQFAPPGRSELPLYLCLVAPPSLPALNATWMAWVAEM